MHRARHAFGLLPPFFLFLLLSSSSSPPFSSFDFCAASRAAITYATHMCSRHEHTHRRARCESHYYGTSAFIRCDGFEYSLVCFVLQYLCEHEMNTRNLLLVGYEFIRTMSEYERAWAHTHTRHTSAHIRSNAADMNLVLFFFLNEFPYGKNNLCVFVKFSFLVCSCVSARAREQWRQFQFGVDAAACNTFDICAFFLFHFFFRFV